MAVVVKLVREEIRQQVVLAGFVRVVLPHVGQMCGVAQCLGSSPLEHAAEVGLAGKWEWVVVQMYAGVW